MILTIDDSSSKIAEAIKHYAINFIVTPKNNYNLNKEVLNLSVNSSIINELGKYIKFILPYGDSEIEYKSVIFKINITKSSDILSQTNTSQLIITTEDNNQEILKEFLENAYIDYNNNLLKKIKNKDKQICLIFDGECWEILSKNKKRKLDTIYLDKGMKESLMDDLNVFLDKKTENWYETRGIPYKYNIILHGYPGTGKSSLIHALASELNYNIALLNFDSTMTDKELMLAIKRLDDNTILVMEDIDVLFKARKENDEFKHKISFSGLINVLDGISNKDKLIIIMTTNYLCNLDSALKRPGRIDKLIEFNYATKYQIKQIYNKFFENCPNFEYFYNKISHLKLTIAMIQEYFINNLNKDINDNLEELEILSQKNLNSFSYYS